ncbi:MAG: hypothetical protein ABFQ95_07345 [Pseudomonadota bacterium]
MKEFEGKEVWLRPTGNNARGNRGKHIKAVVVKVARVNATVRIDGWGRDEKFRFNGHHLDSGYNSGYAVYASQAELVKYYERVRISGLISTEYRYQRDFQRLPLDKLIKVAELLNVVGI